VLWNEKKGKKWQKIVCFALIEDAEQEHNL